MRTWSVYEMNQLIKHKMADLKADDCDDIPVEYITGWAPFLLNDFKVNNQVLIPRDETADLTQMVFGLLRAYEKVTVADVGCGSGAIGITLYEMFVRKGIKAEVFLSDISEAALDTARENARNILENLNEIKFIHSDLLTSYPEKKFDLIIANLPYIPSSRLPHLPKSVIKFEPVSALDGGPDGLLFIRKLLRQAIKFLKQNGRIALEIDETHSLSDFDEFRDEYNLVLTKDSFGKDRFLIVTLSA